MYQRCVHPLMNRFDSPCQGDFPLFPFNPGVYLSGPTSRSPLPFLSYFVPERLLPGHASPQIAFSSDHLITILTRERYSSYALSLKLRRRRWRAMCERLRTWPACRCGYEAKEVQPAKPTAPDSEPVHHSRRKHRSVRVRRPASSRVEIHLERRPPGITNHLSMCSS